MRYGKRLTELELIIMKILWDSDKELTSQEIADESQKNGFTYTLASINQVIPRLLEKEMIEMKALKVAKTKYVRSFLPTISREEYASIELQRLWGDSSSKRISGLKGMIHTFLDNDPTEGKELIDDITNYIKDKC